ncbi:hypothetical protein [Ensifer sp. SSB1]|jgi:metal-dependent amidase/aminoacylase/carboxypeptidase family protein|uniref:hypothetical protein n=1 Tax=Ensifer sp. SSB1 TaxID=2795385 RepID=UPI001A49EB40|nr:hypothetical protein [Ensifer sp. SSB1]MBK5568346.1 hypothetical protein [Ensifer sp. SSB1]
MKDDWKGTLLLAGEPAEEIGGGATAMLKAGLFEKFPKRISASPCTSTVTLPARSP